MSRDLSLEIIKVYLMIQSFKNNIKPHIRVPSRLPAVGIVYKNDQKIIFIHFIVKNFIIKLRIIAKHP